jgi:hypothetical protein
VFACTRSSLGSELALMQDTQHNHMVRTTVTHKFQDLENSFVEILFWPPGPAPLPPAPPSMLGMYSVVLKTGPLIMQATTFPRPALKGGRRRLWRVPQIFLVTIVEA